MTRPKPAPDWISIGLTNGGHMRVRVASIDVFLRTDEGATKLLIRGGPWLTVDRDFSYDLDLALTRGFQWEAL